MKKSLFLLISLCLVYGVTLSQNIENKLGGADGKFIIKEAGADDKVLFSFKEDHFGNSELVIAKDPYVWPFSHDIWMLDVHAENNGPNISFASFTDIDQGAVLHFQKANGNGPGTVNADNILGSIHFTGYTGSGFVTSAIIESKVTSIGTAGPAADITFATSNGTALDVRMAIKNDGTVNIATLHGTTGGGASGDKPVFINSAGDLVAGNAVASPSYGSERIKSLEEENQQLKARLEKLEALVKELAKQQ